MVLPWHHPEKTVEMDTVVTVVADSAIGRDITIAFSMGAVELRYVSLTTTVIAAREAHQVQCDPAGRNDTAVAGAGSGEW